MIIGKEELDRIEELKHREVLLYNIVEYLIELWSINEKDELINKFRTLGFTKDDIKEFEIGK